MKDPGLILARTYDVFLAKFDLVPRSQLTVPKQRFWHFGELSPDCELFAVHASQIYPGEPGAPQPGYSRPTGGIVMQAMDVNVTFLRDQPNIDNAGRIPLGQDLTRAAEGSARDAKVLADAYWTSIDDQSLADVCDTTAFGGVIFSGPEGGILGTTLTFAVQL